MHIKSKWFYAGVATLALGVPSNTFAQDVPEEAYDQIGEGDASRLDAIIVTAQRRAQDVQDIPVSVSALSAENLRERQVVETIDLARSVPNMVTANNVLLGTSVTYFLRGSGSTESIATFDLPVGTYVDEVYIARQNANQIALSGVERIEVLRGPQGTLFGRNTTAGAVSIISKKPDDTLSFEGEASYGSFNRVSVQGAANVPLSDALQTRISAFFVEDDGWLKNPGTDDFNGESSWGARGALRILPADAITWDVSAQYIDTENTGLGVPGIVEPGVAGPFTVKQRSATGDLLTGRYVDEPCEPDGAIQDWAGSGCLYNGVKSTLLISNFGIETGLGDINFITGYSRIRQKFNLDNFANTDQPVLGGGFGPNFYLSNLGKHKQFTQEIKLTGSTADDRLNYTAGFFYLDEKNETDVIDTVDFVDVGPVVFGDRVIDNGTKSYAVYGQLEFEIVPRLVIQAGGRYTDETKDFAVEGLFFGAPVVTQDLADAGIPLELKVKRFTPRVAVLYNLGAESLIYASYTEGFKSGGWNARSFAPGGFVAFNPEYVDSYEIGAKATFLDGRARLNATLFRAEYSDLQVPGILPGSTDFVTVNAASALVQGLELEASVRPATGLTLYSNIGVTDSKYQDLTAPAVAAGIGPELQRMPDMTAQLGFVADLPLGGEHLLTLAGDVKYTSDFETGPANTVVGSVGEYSTVNARMAWAFPGDAIELSVACSNCTNEVFVVQELLGQIFANEPRRITAAVRFDF